MSDIYLQTEDGQVGPLPEAEVRVAYDNQKHAASTMSWKSGEKGWISLGKRWGNPQSSFYGHAAPWLAATSLLLFLGVGVLLPLGLVGEALPSPFHTVVVQATLASVLGVLTLTLLAVCARRSSSHRRVRLPIAVGSLAFLAVTLVSVGALRQTAEVERVRRDIRNATMTLDADGTVLHIDGYIANDFVRDFQDAVGRAPHLSYIEINSRGGLIEDALKAAETIKARGLRVRVTSECASACVLLWAASPSRELGLHGVIGLHQAQMRGDLPQDWRTAAMDLLEPKSEALLKQAGFSSALLAKRSGTSADDMAWIGPVELIDEGVTVRVVDDIGLPAGRSEIVMADVLRRDGSDADAKRLFMAYAHLAPTEALQQAEALRAAQLAKADVNALSAKLGTNARLFALTHAPDAALLKWASEMHVLIGDALSQNNQNACATLMAANQGKPDASAQRRKLKALTDLMAAIPSNAPIAPGNPDGAQWAASIVRTEFTARVQQQGYPAEWDQWTSSKRCEFVHGVYTAALDQRPRDAATAVRVIEGIEHAPDTSVTSDVPTPTSQTLDTSMGGPLQAAMQSKVDDVRERAIREHPDLAVTDAMKEVSSRDAAKKLKTQSPQEQLETAASMFWGFYFLNTRARVDYCADHGVDITPFVESFSLAHSQEFKKARAVFAQSGVNPEDMVGAMRGPLAGMVEQDMRDVMTGAQITTPAETCNLFNDQAEIFVREIRLPALVRRALISN